MTRPPISMDGPAAAKESTAKLATRVICRLSTTMRTSACKKNISSPETAKRIWRLPVYCWHPRRRLPRPKDVAGVPHLPDRRRQTCVLEGGTQRARGRRGRTPSRKYLTRLPRRCRHSCAKRARPRARPAADMDGRGGCVFWIRPACQGALSQARWSVRGTHQLIDRLLVVIE